MSSQSDILSQDEQQYLFSELGMVQVADIDLFNEEPTLDVANNFLTDDVKLNHQPAFAPGGVVLSSEEYCGPYGFEVDIIPNTATKNAWVYSAGLNKVYMTMRSPFPVDFKVRIRPSFDLFIRSTPVYSSPQFAQDCVYRCLNHEFSVEKSDTGLLDHIRPHILRCANRASMYIGDKSKNERLSVVIPLSVPQNPSEIVRELYEFVCKNSCPNPGMNRRAIEVIFTLEDYSGKIYGRKSLNVRICSCPKRDKEKDEKDNLTNGQPPQGKKRKLEKPPKKVVASTDDFKEYSITIPLVGKHNEQHVLKYCHDLMAGEILKHCSSGTEGPYRAVRNKIQALMNKTRRENPKKQEEYQEATLETRRKSQKI